MNLEQSAQSMQDRENSGNRVYGAPITPSGGDDSEKDEEDIACKHTKIMM